MNNGPVGNKALILRPESDKKLTFQAKLTHVRANGEELRDLERRIAELLSERFQEAAASPPALQASDLTSPADDTLVASYRSALDRLQITISGISLLSIGNAEAFLKPISAKVAALLREKAIVSVNESTDICICAVSGIPGSTIDLAPVFDAIGTLPPVDGGWRILMLMKVAPHAEDLIAIDVPDDTTLPLNETEIAFGNNTDWHKQITAWTFCKDRTSTIEANPNVVEPVVRMRLRRAECRFGEADTIIFRKPKFLYIWTDMYNFAPDQFWTLHGGRRITYVWCWHGTGEADFCCGGFTVGRGRPIAQGDDMQPGEVLNPGQSITSANGRFRFIYQGDGNLVLYDGGTPLWASGTAGANICIMQADGNLVIYSCFGPPLWASGTAVAGSRLVVQDDGNVVIYSPGGTPLWATNAP